MVLAIPDCDLSGPLYYMFRDLARSDGDREWLRTMHLRYDVTVIPPASVCGECVKTKGHFHPDNSAGIGYPEIYEVISGSAEYLLQDRRQSDIVAVRVGKGEKVLIPPGYGHVTINPGNDTLVMANIVSTEFESEYLEYEQMRGGAFYRMADGTYARNERCRSGISLRRIEGCNLSGFPELAVSSLYDLVGNPGALRFLNHQEEYGFLDVLMH
jgi:glucose-6-phosphate isomerase, archaeal